MPDSRMASVSLAALVFTVFTASLLVTLAPASVAQTTVNVVINSYSFNPASITVVIGANNTVTWTNQQTGVPHTVTSDDGTWGSATLTTGQSFTHAFTTPGTFGYHCSIHTYMKGTVIVLSSGQASTTTTTAATTTTTNAVTTATTATATTAASSTTTAATTAVTASTTTTTAAQTTSTAAPSASSAASAGNGVPEFPYSIAAVTAVTILVAVSYLLTRRSAGTGKPLVGPPAPV
ncbi:MAG: cupredoxin domain-containing protein [Nitrososphaerota archaeon]|nr:cupredoxin domain-containing protein [Nitrososphaerota archaeon]